MASSHVDVVDPEAEGAGVLAAVSEGEARELGVLGVLEPKRLVKR